MDLFTNSNGSFKSIMIADTIFVLALVAWLLVKAIHVYQTGESGTDIAKELFETLSLIGQGFHAMSGANKIFDFLGKLMASGTAK